MGSIVSLIKENAGFRQDSHLLKCNIVSLVSLSKLREYHGSFKSICANFAIDLREFEQIFGKDDGFAIWDEDRNGLIDALELFSGLILFSEDKFEDKIRCKED
jgi:hypothetical protein